VKGGESQGKERLAAVAQRAPDLPIASSTIMPTSSRLRVADVTVRPVVKVV